MSHNFKKFANSFQSVARLRLEGIGCLMKHLGNVQNELNFIHVAGTNGKGSVCSFLQNIFTDAGFKTGLYTSPNLISVRERISVDGEMISENDITRILRTVEIAANKVKTELGELPTQFEIWTAAAFYYFKEQKCDMVILETGMGGTRDATNIIPPAAVNVITTVDIDHVEYLGNCIEDIAAAKAGIIKKPYDSKRGITVSAIQSPKVAEILSQVCAEKNHRLIFANTPKLNSFDDFCENFDYIASNGTIYRNIKCGISGFYQPGNAVLAIEAALALGIDAKHIKSGIEKAQNPGRFEIIHKNPTVIYDGAHNKNGMSSLAASLNHYFPDWHGAVFIMAFMADKDIAGSLGILKNSGLLTNSQVFAVKVKDNPRAAETDIICSAASCLGINAVGYPDLKDAYTKALTLGLPVVLCGSLYLYKDLDEVIKNL